MQTMDLASAVPMLIQAAATYRIAVADYNDHLDEVKNEINAKMATLASAADSLKALGLNIGETVDYHNPDDVSRVLDTLKVALRQVSLSAII